MVKMPDKGLGNGEETFGAKPHERPVPRISIHAFCEFPDTGAALQRAGGDRRLSKAHLTVQLGGLQAALPSASDRCWQQRRISADRTA